VIRPTKAVFPIAALGRRHPAPTNNGRVEMMPIMDKPLVQYAIEDALDGGFTELIFITGPGQRSNGSGSGRFDELQAALELHGRTELLEAIRSFVPRSVECIFIRQADPLGIGHAIHCARAIIGNSPFAVVLPDELVHSPDSLLAQMVEQYESYRCSILSAYPLGAGETSPHGIVKCAAWLDSLFQVGGIVENPPADETAPCFGIAGRFIFTPSLFRHLEALSRNANGDLRLPDALARMLRQETMLAFNFEGTRYDCSSKLGYLKAMLAFGLAHPEVGADLASHLGDLFASIRTDPFPRQRSRARAETTTREAPPASPLKS
jgi:UTP--glucose-1-phosphate uridylyltransferase